MRTDLKRGCSSSWWRHEHRVRMFRSETTPNPTSTATLALLRRIHEIPRCSCERIAKECPQPREHTRTIHHQQRHWPTTLGGLSAENVSCGGAACTHNTRSCRTSSTSLEKMASSATSFARWLNDFRPVISATACVNAAPFPKSSTKDGTTPLAASGDKDGSCSQFAPFAVHASELFR